MTTELLSVRSRGLEPIQQQDRGIRDAETHALIARHEVRGLCRPNPFLAISRPDHVVNEGLMLVGRESGQRRLLPEIGETNARKRTEKHGHGDCREPAGSRIRTGGARGCAGL